MASAGALLTGDTLLTAIPPLVIRRGFALPYVTFTTDMKLAVESVSAFHRSGVDYELPLARARPAARGRRAASGARVPRTHGVTYLAPMVQPAAPVRYTVVPLIGGTVAILALWLAGCPSQSSSGERPVPR